MQNPFNRRLMAAIRTKYAEQEKAKGDTWKDIDMRRLWDHFYDEHVEVTVALSKVHEDGFKPMRDELIDLMLVCGMLYRRLDPA